MKQTDRMRKLLNISDEAPKPAASYVDNLLESTPPVTEGKPRKKKKTYTVELSIDVDEQMVLDEVNRHTDGVRFSSAKAKTIRFPVKASIMAVSGKDAQKQVLDIIRKVSEKSRIVSGGSYKLYKE